MTEFECSTCGKPAQEIEVGWNLCEEHTLDALQKYAKMFRECIDEIWALHNENKRLEDEVTMYHALVRMEKV
jgi:hypothetical protein